MDPASGRAVRRRGARHGLVSVVVRVAETRLARLRRPLAKKAGGAGNELERENGKPGRALERAVADLESAGSSHASAIGVEPEQAQPGPADVPPGRIAEGYLRGAV